MRLEGAPDVPQELIDALLPFQNTRSASLSDLAPDGESMLITTRFADTSQVHLVTQAGGARTQLTFREERSYDASFDPRQEGAFVFRSDTGGDESYRIFRFDPTTGRPEAVTDSGPRVSSYRWNNAHDALAFSSNQRNGTDTDVWLGDGMEQSNEELAFSEGGYTYAIDFSPDDSRLLVGRYISITESELFVVDLESGEFEKITPDEPGSYAYGAFDASGSGVWVASDRGGEFIGLHHHTLESGEWRAIETGIDWNLEDLAATSDRERLALVFNEDGLSRVYLFDTGTEELTPIRAVPDGIIYGLQFAEEADVLGFTFNGPTTTGDVYTVNASDLSLTRWTNSEMGGLDASRLVEPELVHFTSFDGLEIPAFYYAPSGSDAAPVVINIHGGPESQARPYFSPTTQYMVTQMGFAVIVPNVRGSDGYGRSYVSLDNGMNREDSVRDIGALLDWIEEQPELDESRVAVIGGSYGGYMVLASLVHYGERLVAGIDVVGISNFVTFLENTQDYRRDLRRVEYGDERDPDMRAFLEEISPLNRVDEIQSALFVAQGANDPRVPASEAEQIVAAVRDEGRDVWYMLAENEGHGFSRKENRDLYTQLSLLFLGEHLSD